ncbi:MAG: hypothetical protein QM784_21865 [Polyangiaceae bacterium]
MPNPSVTVSVAAVLYVAQPPGSLDASFGRSGVTTLADVLPPQATTEQPRESPRAVVVDGAGQILIGGYSSSTSTQGWVLRLTAEGALDSSFGQGGIVSGFGVPDSRVLGLVLNEEQLYVGAELTNASATTLGYLRRLSAKGLPETAFNGGLDVMLPASPSAVTWFDDSALVTAGGAPYAYLADGTKTPSFVSLTTLAIESLVLTSSKRLLHGRTVSNHGFEIGRLLSSGGVDSGFGKSGIASVTCPESKPFAFDRSITLLPPSSEAAVLALINCGPGPMVGSELFQSELVAISTDGTPLSTFGQAGRFTVVPSGQGTAAVTQADGKFVVLGRHVIVTTSSTDVKTKLTRIEATGTLDSTFGTSGSVELTPIEDNVMAYDAKARRIIVVGSNTTSTGGGLAIFRVWL